jgi:hypothetical protein
MPNGGDVAAEAFETLMVMAERFVAWVDARTHVWLVTCRSDIAKQMVARCSETHGS